LADDAVHRIAELARSGRRAEAAELCRQLLSREPDRPDLLRFFGWLQLQTGQWQEAEQSFARVLARNRDVMPLFDTIRMTRNLESAYLRMWERHQRGEQTTSFALEPSG
jgi:tetratricopeptide (TPR) repeat protein